MTTTKNNCKNAEHHNAIRNEQDESEDNEDYNVDTIDIDKLDALINQAAEATRIQQETIFMEEDPDQSRHLLRIKLFKMDRGFIYQTKIGQQFKGVFLPAKELDKFFEILPFLSPDQKLQNIHTSHFNPNKLDITSYHKPYTKGQMWSLTGQRHIATEFQMDTFTQKMDPWIKKMHYQILPAVSQEEEMGNNWILGKSKLLTLPKRPEDLQRAIIGHPLWKIEDLLIFTLHHHKKFMSPGKATQMLCVNAEKSKAEAALTFFMAIYDGQKTRLPLEACLLMIPIYHTPLTDTECTQIAVEHEDWNEKEIPMLVSGFMDLSTKFRLANRKIVASL